jgi:hypothetical protein
LHPQDHQKTWCTPIVTTASRQSMDIERTGK